MWHEAGHLLDLYSGNIRRLYRLRTIQMCYSMLPGFLVGLSLATLPNPISNVLDKVSLDNPMTSLLLRLSLAQTCAVPLGLMMRSPIMFGYPMNPVEISADNFKDMIDRSREYRGILRVTPTKPGHSFG